MERAAAKIGVGKRMILDISTTEVRKPRALRGIVDPPEAVVCDRFHQMGVAQAPPAPCVDSATASSSRRVNISGSCGKPALIDGLRAPGQPPKLLGRIVLSQSHR